MLSNYRSLSSATRFNSYPMPHMSDIKATLHGTIVSSKIDLVLAYHQIPFATEDLEITVFKVSFDLFEFLSIFFAF